MISCIFCKIIQGKLPVKKIFEDDEVIAFYDIKPASEIHALLIPKLHIESLGRLQPVHYPLAAKITLAIPNITNILGLSQGFKILVNTGIDGGQKVFHLHYHILGGKGSKYHKL